MVKVFETKTNCTRRFLLMFIFFMLLRQQAEASFRLRRCFHASVVNSNGFLVFFRAFNNSTGLL